MDPCINWNTFANGILIIHHHIKSTSPMMHWKLHNGRQVTYLAWRTTPKQRFVSVSDSADEEKQRMDEWGVPHLAIRNNLPFFKRSISSLAPDSPPLRWPPSSLSIPCAALKDGHHPP
jgi:hypothetical protein